MQTTIQQQEFLKAKLNGLLKYSETYAEVYDHILLALTLRTNPKSFEAAVNDIIEEDFGGDFELRRMEDKCRVAAIKKVKKQYRVSFFSWFKSAPLLASMVATFLLLNYIALQSLLIVELVLGVIVLVPEINFIARRIRAGYLFGDAKASLRDAILKKMTYGSVFIYIRLAILSQSIIIVFSIPKQQTHYVEQLIITVYAVLFIIRAAILSKLYKGDIELSLNQ
jgi:hypothetical protein